MKKNVIRELDKSIALIELTPIVRNYIDFLREKGYNVSALKVFGDDINTYFGWAGDKCFIEDKNLVRLGAVLKAYSLKDLSRRDGDLSFVTPMMDMIDIDGHRIRSTAPNERFQISSGFYKGNIDEEAIRVSYSGRII